MVDSKPCLQTLGEGESGWLWKAHKHVVFMGLHLGGHYQSFRLGN